MLFPYFVNYRKRDDPCHYDKTDKIEPRYHAKRIGSIALSLSSKRFECSVLLESVLSETASPIDLGAAIDLGLHPTLTNDNQESCVGRSQEEAQEEEEKNKKIGRSPSAKHICFSEMIELVSIQSSLVNRDLHRLPPHTYTPLLPTSPPSPPNLAQSHVILTSLQVIDSHILTSISLIY